MQNEMKKYKVKPAIMDLTDALPSSLKNLKTQVRNGVLRVSAPEINSELSMTSDQVIEKRNQERLKAQLEYQRHWIDAEFNQDPELKRYQKFGKDYYKELAFKQELKKVEQKYKAKIYRESHKNLIELNDRKVGRLIRLLKDSEDDSEIERT